MMLMSITIEMDLHMIIAPIQLYARHIDETGCISTIETGCMRHVC